MAVSLSPDENSGIFSLMTTPCARMLLNMSSIVPSNVIETICSELKAKTTRKLSEIVNTNIGSDITTRLDEAIMANMSNGYSNTSIQEFLEQFILSSSLFDDENCTVSMRTRQFQSFLQSYTMERLNFAIGLYVYFYRATISKIDQYRFYYDFTFMLETVVEQYCTLLTILEIKDLPLLDIEPVARDLQLLAKKQASFLLFSRFPMKYMVEEGRFSDCMKFISSFFTMSPDRVLYLCHLNVLNGDFQRFLDILPRCIALRPTTLSLYIAKWIKILDFQNQSSTLFRLFTLCPQSAQDHILIAARTCLSLQEYDYVFNLFIMYQEPKVIQMLALSMHVNGQTKRFLSYPFGKYLSTVIECLRTNGVESCIIACKLLKHIGEEDKATSILYACLLGDCTEKQKRTIFALLQPDT